MEYQILFFLGSMEFLYKETTYEDYQRVLVDDGHVKYYTGSSATKQGSDLEEMTDMRPKPFSISRSDRK